MKVRMPIMAQRAATALLLHAGVVRLNAIKDMEVSNAVRCTFGSKKLKIGEPLTFCPIRPVWIFHSRVPRSRHKLRWLTGVNLAALQNDIDHNMGKILLKIV